MRVKRQHANRSLRRAHTAKALKLPPVTNWDGYEVFVAPEIFSWVENRKDCAAYIYKIRQIIDNKNIEKKQIRVELNETTKIDVGAALLLVAELDRWCRRDDITLRVSTVHTWREDIVCRLYSLGFFKILRTDINQIYKKKASKEWIPFSTDSLAVAKAAALLRRKLSSILVDKPEYFLPIFRPLKEAMINAIEHGYPDGDYDYNSSRYLGKRWWMAGALHAETGYVEVTFLDLGITIPRSLEPWVSKQEISFPGRLKNDSHARRIYWALLYGTSATNESHRGKGSRDILGPAKLYPGNAVIVSSGKGTLIALGDDTRYVIESDVPVAGTMITWYIKYNA